MNYQRIYQSLIERAKSRTLDCYTELHHIVPRCLGGSNDKTNLVRLTPEEHYVAHQLLVKMHPKNGKLIYAASMMCPSSRLNEGQRNNKLYGWLRRKLAAEAKKRVGSKNGSFGTRWVNDGSGLSRKIKGDLPEGWNEGRVVRQSRVPSGPRPWPRAATIAAKIVCTKYTDEQICAAITETKSVKAAMILLGAPHSGYTSIRFKKHFASIYPVASTHLKG